MPPVKDSDFDLAATLALKVDEIDLEALDDEQLAELRAAEAADSSPRKTLLKAIDAEAAKRGTDAPAEVTTMDGPPKPGTDAQGRDFKHADYDGLLTIPQGEWRRANLKPGGAVVTK